MSLEVKLMKKLGVQAFEKPVNNELIFIPLSEENFTNLAKIILNDTLNSKSRINSRIFNLLGFLGLNKLRERIYQNQKLLTNLENTGIILWGTITVLLFVLSVYLLF